MLLTSYGNQIGELCGALGATDYPDTFAVDDDYALVPATKWLLNSGTMAANFDIAFNANYTVTGVEIIYAAGATGISSATFFTSMNGVNWTSVASDSSVSGKAALINYNITAHTARFGRLSLVYASTTNPSLRHIAIFGCDQGTTHVVLAFLHTALFQAASRLMWPREPRSPAPAQAALPTPRTLLRGPAAAAYPGVLFVC